MLVNQRANIGNTPTMQDLHDAFVIGQFPIGIDDEGIAGYRLKQSASHLVAAASAEQNQADIIDPDTDEIVTT